MSVTEKRVQEIRVIPLTKDVLGESVLYEVQRTLGVQDISKINSARVFRLLDATNDQANALASILVNPQTHLALISNPTVYRLDTSSGDLFLPLARQTQTSATVEIAKLFGVVNTEVDSLLKAAQDRGIDLSRASTGTEFTFHFGNGQVNKEEIKRVVNELLVNRTVETATDGQEEVMKLVHLPDTAPTLGPKEFFYDTQALTVDQRDEVQRNFKLNEEELQAVEEYSRQIGRPLTFLELAVISAYWSEHCSHKTFKSPLIVDGVEKPPLMKRIVERSSRYFRNPKTGEVKVISAFKDNAGVFLFFEGTAINIKAETHNSPSALEPRGGAMTGSGGVFRDILGTGQGARVILSTNMHVFANPDMDLKDLPFGCLPPDYLLRKVIAGVRDYGNPVGIPTINGSVHFDRYYRAKPSVYVGAVGILPEERAEKGKPKVGDLVIMIGGKTGADGINGAVFSSVGMTHDSREIYSQAVQIGDPITEKVVIDAVLELRDKGLIRAINDFGAAGIPSAIGEMAKDVGVTIDLAKVPLKYPLEVWQIAMSESQERMALAIDPDKLEDVMQICQKHGVDASWVGVFDGSKKMTLKHGEEIYAELDYEFLEEKMPTTAKQATLEEVSTEQQLPDLPADWIQTIKAVLSNWNVCSKEAIVRQFDHTVQGATAIYPYAGVERDGPNDAAVIAPILGKPYGVIYAHGLNPTLSRLNSNKSAKWAFTEAMANYVAVGGDPAEAVAMNNYVSAAIREGVLGQLDQAVEGVLDCVDAYKVPVISGKDSLSSTYTGSNLVTNPKDGNITYEKVIIEVPIGVNLSIVGKTADVEKTVTADIKNPGESVLCLVGKLDEGMGGSAYFQTLGIEGGQVPDVDLATSSKVFEKVYQTISSGEVSACHDVSEGGVITTVFEMCVGGDNGVELSLGEGQRADTFLFNETVGCFVVEVADSEAAEKLFKGIPYQVLGRTTVEKKIKANLGNQPLFEADLDEFKAAWKKPLGEIFV